MPVTTTSSSGKKNDLPRDYDKIFDKRLKAFRFTAIPPKLEEWEGGSIVNNVYDVEMTIRNFKSSEERLMYRMDLWIDVCRIETYVNGALTNGTGKFHSAKRLRKLTESSLTKVRSFSMGRQNYAQSTETLIKCEDKSTKPRPKSNEFVLATEIKTNKARMAPSKSTNNLLDDRNNYDAQGNYKDIEETIDKFGTNPKRKLKLFLFRKKEKNPDDGTISTKNNDRDNSSISSKEKANGKKSWLASATEKYKRNIKTKISSKNAKLKHDDDEQKDSDEEQNEHLHNNNISLVGSSKRVRPSVFDMESLKGSIDNLDDGKTYNYDPSRRRKNHAQLESNKFNTLHVSSATTLQPSQQQQDPFFSKIHNDSVKRYKSKYHCTDRKFDGPVFFDETKPRLENTFRTEIGEI